MGLAIRICTTDPLNCTVTPFPLFPPPPPTSTMGGESASQQFNPLLIIVFAILGGTFLLLTYYSVVLKYCSCLNRLRMVHPPPPPQGETGREDLLDEDHGPVIDHPIWFIRTVGLAENIINSIDVFKYKKGEGLIDGTECSVCLGEFEEDEKLRLLPKCSHAFHLPCIDTWLRSHTNCPLCRAPIVSNPAGASDVSTVTEMHSSNLSTVHETEEDSPDREGASRRNPSSEGGSGYEIDLIVSDGTREVEKAGVTEEGEGSHIQPVRRSFSMGSLAAAMVCFSLANLPPSELESSSSTRVVSVKESNSDVVVKSEGESSTILNQMGSSFSGEAPNAGPIAMKRSVSTSAKYLLSRYAGTKSSILPL